MEKDKPLASVTDITTQRTRQRLLEEFEKERKISNWYGGLVVQARKALDSGDFIRFDELLQRLRSTNDSRGM